MESDEFLLLAPFYFSDGERGVEIRDRQNERERERGKDAGGGGGGGERQKDRGGEGGRVREPGGGCCAQTVCILPLFVIDEPQEFGGHSETVRWENILSAMQGPVMLKLKHKRDSAVAISCLNSKDTDVAAGSYLLQSLCKEA